MNSRELSLARSQVRDLHRLRAISLDVVVVEASLAPEVVAVSEQDIGDTDRKSELLTLFNRCLLNFAQSTLQINDLERCIKVTA